jgi:hypothetical protein
MKENLGRSIKIFEYLESKGYELRNIGVEDSGRGYPYLEEYLVLQGEKCIAKINLRTFAVNINHKAYLSKEEVKKLVDSLSELEVQLLEKGLVTSLAFRVF